MNSLNEALQKFVSVCDSLALEELQSKYNSVSSIGEQHYYKGQSCPSNSRFCRTYRSNTQGLVHLLGIQFDGRITKFRDYLKILGIKLSGVDARFTDPAERERRSHVSREMHQDWTEEKKKQRGEKISLALRGLAPEKIEEPKVFKYQIPVEKSVKEKPAPKIQEKKVRPCLVCGGPISGLGPKKYCSQECKNSAKKTMCGICGKEIISYRGKKKFCSTECENKSKSQNSIQVIYSCPTCGKKFKEYPSIQRTFCSIECRNNFSVIGESKCIICGKAIPLLKSRSNRTFCSQECRRTRARKIAACLHCGKEFPYIEGNRPGIFCSRLCRNYYFLEQGRCGIKINKVEKLLSENLPSFVEYTGDHQFWISLESRIKNPDFVVRPFHETKRVIELFGGEGYWHTREEAVDLIKQYGEKGIDCLIVWETDIRSRLSEVKAQIDQWLKSPHPFKKP